TRSSQASAASVMLQAHNGLPYRTPKACRRERGTLARRAVGRGNASSVAKFGAFPASPPGGPESRAPGGASEGTSTLISRQIIEMAFGPGRERQKCLAVPFAEERERMAPAEGAQLPAPLEAAR